MHCIDKEKWPIYGPDWALYLSCVFAGRKCQSIRLSYSLKLTLVASKLCHHVQHLLVVVAVFFKFHWRRWYGSLSVSVGKCYNNFEGYNTPKADHKNRLPFQAIEHTTNQRKYQKPCEIICSSIDIVNARFISAAIGMYLFIKITWMHEGKFKFTFFSNCGCHCMSLQSSSHSTRMCTIMKEKKYMRKWND